MIVYPNAKINLGLNVVSKRPDGYHNIETLFYPVPLCDMLEVVFPADSNPDGYVWQSSGMALDCEPANNLCIRALNLLRERFAMPTVGLHLHKIIPLGAGLGGGSSDGAHVLKVLAEQLLPGKISTAELCQLAARLGADCPFFIVNKPMFATGIGDVQTPVDLNLRGLNIMIVKPPLHITTADAYRNVTPKQPDENIVDIVSKPIHEWKNRLKNDFEESIATKHTIIADIKAELYNRGALYAAMTGSGSAVYGLFDKEADTSGFDKFFVWSGKL